MQSLICLSSNESVVKHKIVQGLEKVVPSRPAFPLLFHENPASRDSVVAIRKVSFSFPIPHLCPSYGEFRFQVAVKSRTPLTSPESCGVFWPNPGSREKRFRPYHCVRQFFCKATKVLCGTFFYTIFRIK